MHITRRRGWYPGGLYWRVTASYFLVTLVAALTIAVAMTVMPSERSTTAVSTQAGHSVIAAQAVPTDRNGSLNLDQVQPTTIYFLLLAIVVGTLTGLVVSRSITHRLRNITKAAGAWSQGDFQVTVHDTSRDELGQLAQDLNSMAEQVRTLLITRQELAVVEERTRLARDLHDSVKQQVFANALLIRAARKLLAHDPAKAQTHLTEAEELATETQQALIDLIQALRPASIADKGLVSVLQEYTTDWSRRMGIPVNIHIQDERTTPLDQEEALFRVIQEALANVARHSDADTVEVQLAWTTEHLSLIIQDNGHGFLKRSSASKGSGLTNMRERVEALAGTFSVTSTTTGTRIDASLPLTIPITPALSEVSV